MLFTEHEHTYTSGLNMIIIEKNIYKTVQRMRFSSVC